jgi:hypothetical protein
MFGSPCDVLLRETHAHARVRLTHTHTCTHTAHVRTLMFSSLRSWRGLSMYPSIYQSIPPSFHLSSHLSIYLAIHYPSIDRSLLSHLLLIFFSSSFRFSFTLFFCRNHQVHMDGDEAVLIDPGSSDLATLDRLLSHLHKATYLHNLTRFFSYFSMVLFLCSFSLFFPASFLQIPVSIRAVSYLLPLSYFSEVFSDSVPFFLTLHSPVGPPALRVHHPYPSRSLGCGVTVSSWLFLCDMFSSFFPIYFFLCCCFCFYCCCCCCCYCYVNIIGPSVTIGSWLVYE